jgi:NAD(P)-dependent dehydrogenase (short-subunit alcohol dehydrogenase family)
VAVVDPGGIGIVMTVMSAVIFGSSGGIGRALVAAALADGQYAQVFAVSRTGATHPGAVAIQADFTDDDSLAAAAASIAKTGPVRLCVVASGLLSGEGASPEKSYKAQSLAAFEAVFAANTFGPALIAKHMLPLLAAEGRSVFAALSARVGSISDNRLGGWHAYRASKAALNMLIRNYALETARRCPEAVIVGLHPGTVATGLSAPFRGGVKTENLFTPEQSAAHLMRVIHALTPDQSGKVFDWAGAEIPA